MSRVAIKAENLSKAYQLGEFTTGTLSRDIQRKIALMRGKEDPYLKIGQTNDRTQKGTSDIVWSLKDINFDIMQGDAVGIIGRNGAGKSTLLKVLSRVTTPTSGSVKIKGRIASLLEVGTGFHPELTGRENIFLNGAILGMRKHEIRRHFDAIVDFAGVERYIDTPVKRYSSGMYVRLAFAVAAHLESEIMIVDEVLAVGDAEFQRKCLGKMNDVSRGQGRTVLFVSHNMASIKSLCQKGIFLKFGEVACSGSVEDALTAYSESIKNNADLVNVTSYTAPSDNGKDAQITGLQIVDENDEEKYEFDVHEPVFLKYDFVIRKPGLAYVTPIINVEKDGVELFWSFASDMNQEMLESWEVGHYSYKVPLLSPLKKGRYNISAKLGKLKVGDIDVVNQGVQFFVDEFSFDPTLKSFASARGGIIPALIKWDEMVTVK